MSKNSFPTIEHQSGRQHNLPIVQIVGYKNSGKTTLLTSLVSYFATNQDWQIGTIKHDRHAFEMDKENTDTWKHRQAGAQATLIQGPDEIGLTMHHKDQNDLSTLIKMMSSFGLFNVLFVEGYKNEPYDKIVLIRNSDDFQLIEQLTNIIGLVFWNEADEKMYKSKLNEGIYKSFATTKIGEQHVVGDWVHDWYNKIIL